MSRLFFALWPDDRVRAELAAQRDRIAHDYAGRATRADTLHLTILFLGDVNELRVPTLMACGDCIKSAAFKLRIDACAHFPEARVAWLGCTEPPAALFDLHHALLPEVRAAQISVDESEYQPHITVARSCTLFPSPHPIPEVDWPVESFVLIDSRRTEAGPLYRVLKYWPLGL